MNRERLIQIIEAYGALPEHWPEQERDVAQDLLCHDVQAQRLVETLGPVDDALDSYVPDALPHIRTRILASLPHRLWLDRVLEWLFPRELLSNFWRPLLAASLPLVAGLVLGGSVFAVEATDTWEDEIILIALDEGALATSDE